MVNILGWHISRTTNAATQSGGQASVPQTQYNAFSGMGLINTQMRTKRSDYANAFGPTNALVQEALGREIYPLGPTGVRLYEPYPKTWQVLQCPNVDMDFTSFLRTAMVGYLTSAETHILLWHDSDGRGTDPAPGFTDIQHLCGMTFLPKGSRTQLVNQQQYSVLDAHGQRQTVTDDSILTLHYSLDPATLVPISPVSASHEFAEILDSLAMQLRSYFNNNATPQMMVTIHAKTAQEFQAIRHSFEAANRGPGNSYGTVYQHVVDNGVEGGGNPRIEITPVGGSPINMDIQTICDVASQKINANLGVSSLIYGDTDSVSYQNQEVVNDKFNRRVVNTLKQFLRDLTFELNRVTGGIGFTFGFDYQETEFAEKELTQAQTIYAKAQAFQILVNAGVPSDLAAQAVDAPDTWQGMGATRPQAQPSTTVTTPVNVYAGQREQKLSTREDKSGDNPEPKQEKAENSADTRVADREPEKHDKIKDLLISMAKARIKRDLGPATNDVPDQDRKYVLQLEGLLQEIADNGGTTVARQLAQQIHTQTISTGYEISGTPLQQLADRAAMVIDKYSQFLDEQIAKAQHPTIDQDGNQITPDKQSALKDLLVNAATGLIASRASEIMISEGKNAFQTGQLDNAQNIQDLVGPKGVVVRKIWKTTSLVPCEFCQAMNGTEAGVADGFVTDGIITTADGDSLALDSDYSNGDLPDAHANCQCVFTWEVDESGVIDTSPVSAEEASQEGEDD